ncbi:MAG: glycosyltransferase family 2 protein [Oscillospiraceae bacterium]|nr:glycosyltransferase family 2 protein [Oscillospiraceae bacterium]
MPDTLYIVVPCYNEEAVLPETSSRLRDKLLRMISAGIVDDSSKIMFVDDGSKDKTWEIIEALHDSDALYSAVKLSRNKGHQNALMAGIMTAMRRADVTISIDADLQDDIECLDEFIRQYNDGCDIVYGVRGDRPKDTAFKKASAQTYYRLLKILGVNVVFNHADYRLMSKRAMEGLASFREVNLFLRGIVPLIGYKSGTVTYSRGERFAGESKYPLKKMLAFAWEGVSSFSVLPMRFITILGILTFIISLGFMLYTFIMAILPGRTVPGWSTLMISIWLLGGLQLLALGVIGEYIGKIYSEIKDRPKYIIETILE